MTKGTIIGLLKIERECVRREDCDRNCAACELARDRDELIEMYGAAIEMIAARQPPKKNYKDSYDILDALCEERGISRRKLAQLAGMNESTCSSLFARRPELKYSYAKAFAEVFGVGVTELYTGPVSSLWLDEFSRDQYHVPPDIIRTPGLPDDMIDFFKSAPAVRDQYMAQRLDALDDASRIQLCDFLARLSKLDTTSKEADND